MRQTMSGVPKGGGLLEKPSVHLTQVCDAHYTVDQASFLIQQQQQSLFLVKIYNFNILTGPRIASASLGGPVHQDII